MWETLHNYYVPSLEIIAEVGCNHKGNVATALEYVRQARACGATTVKFQSFVADKLVNPGDIAEFCRKSQLSYESHCAILDECESEGIKPLFSVFDRESLDMLCTLGMNEVKVPSGQIFNHALLYEIAVRGLRPYVSTGMCSMHQVRRAYDTLVENGTPNEDIVLLQCTTCYPAPFEDANLQVISSYRREFGTAVGYSDHTPGWSASIGAVALGASVIEKHFIFDPGDDTPDACVSLSPVEFTIMVNHLREVQAARGTAVKRPRHCEEKMFKRRDFTKNGHQYGGVT